MIDRSDKLTLLENAAFQRFLFAMIEAGGVFEATATMADGRTLFLEGRRSLALEMLRDLDAVQPLPLPGGVPIQTLIQTLRERVQSAHKETGFD
ncbi:hypothetical protein GCM10009087_52320 [Sphingomonas oligophenolica]|uniref:Bbp19-like phage domain-containing protein n=1 Tax=Sphingomonas oligophenolica TaxID=301154 RepID=A0ABU9Y6Y3_9SPHN